jgi:hypothetical protein
MALQPLWTWLFFQFLDHFTDGRTPWTSDQPVARPLSTHRKTQTQNKCTQTSMPRVGFESTIPVFKRAKTVPVLDRAATVIGQPLSYLDEFATSASSVFLWYLESCETSLEVCSNSSIIGKLLPVLNQALRHEDAWSCGGVSPSFLTSALDEGEWPD